MQPWEPVAGCRAPPPSAQRCSALVTASFEKELCDGVGGGLWQEPVLARRWNLNAAGRKARLRRHCEGCRVFPPAMVAFYEEYRGFATAVSVHNWTRGLQELFILLQFVSSRPAVSDTRWRHRSCISRTAVATDGIREAGYLQRAPCRSAPRRSAPATWQPARVCFSEPHPRLHVRPTTAPHCCQHARHHLPPTVQPSRVPPLAAAASSKAPEAMPNRLMESRTVLFCRQHDMKQQCTHSMGA